MVLVLLNFNIFCNFNRRDLSRAVTLLEMVKKREKTKRDQLHLTVEVFQKRYQLRDFSGSLTSELSSSIKSSR